MTPNHLTIDHRLLTLSLQADHMSAPDVHPLSDNPSSVDQTGFFSLPNELLHLICDKLDVTDLHSLILLSRRLHYIALPIYLSRHGISNPTDHLEISGHTFRLIPTLRICLYIATIKQLSCKFNDPEYKFMDYRPLTTPHQDISNLERLVSKLYIDEVTLDFGKLGYWYILGDNASRFRTLLAATARVCSHLTVKRDMRFARNFSVDFMQTWRDWKQQTSNQPARVVASRPLVSLKGALKTLKRRTFSSSSITVASVDHHPRLKTFTLNTTMLFEHPLLYEWMINTLNASHLVSLSIRFPPRLDLPILDLVLPSLTIPSLREFSIQCETSFKVLTDFLSRHTNIATLTIGREAHDPIRSRRLPNACLSLLTTLNATPEYIIYLLQSPNDLPQLRSISILSYIPFGPCWDVTGLDHSLASIARRVRDTNISLNISVVSDVFCRPYESLGDRESHVLDRVTSLTLELDAPLPFAVGGDALYFFPDWLENFPPSLEHISLAGSWFACTEHRAKEDLVRLISNTYPRIRTITLDGEQCSSAMST
jgi:hypothetical protein